MTADLMTQLMFTDLPVPLTEIRFHPPRRWRFDFAWPDHKLAVEVDGATWAGGRHVRGRGYERDCEKVNAAVLEGWRVLRFTTAMVADGRALAAIRAAMTEEA